MLYHSVHQDLMRICCVSSMRKWQAKRARGKTQGRCNRWADSCPINHFTSFDFSTALRDRKSNTVTNLKIRKLRLSKGKSVILSHLVSGSLYTLKIVELLSWFLIAMTNTWGEKNQLKRERIYFSLQACWVHCCRPEARLNIMVRNLERKQRDYACASRLPPSCPFIPSGIPAQIQGRSFPLSSFFLEVYPEVCLLSC
jgi:hypothetical protein